MKTLKFILLFFLPILMFGQTSFDKANELYKQENYQKAIDTYEEILESGQHSVELYYNLGNTYYKLNKIAPAIYNYEKALLLEPNNSDVKNNLKFVQNMMIDSFTEIPKVGFSNWLSGFTSVYHYDVWANIAIGFSFLVLLSFIGYYFISRMVLKRTFFGLALFFLVCSVLSVMIASFEKNQNQNYNPAIVFSESVIVRAEPNPSSANAALMHEGTKVYILESLDNYYKVELPNGVKGWVLQTTVKPLK